MFIAQPTYGFGHLICDEMFSEQSGHLRWHTVEFAVAWANYSGMNRLFDSMQTFLSKGGRIRVTVGLDFGSTTYEGLGRLLELEHDDNIITHVFFDENQARTFHPKVFLFSNDEEAYLLVGSNNMTSGGLETNIEAALGFSGALRDKTISDAHHALVAWRDEGRDSRIRRLTRELREQLRDRRYVLTEEEIRTRRRSEDGLRGKAELPLFGMSPIHPLRAEQRTNGYVERVGRTTGSALGEVLLMRLRPRRDGKQVQISMKVLAAPFMNGVKEVVSVDGIMQEIGFNMTNGVRNTARFEAPEMKDMQNPVARFQWVNAGPPEGEQTRVLQFEIFDAENDEEGLTILRKLEEGIATPPLTNLEELSKEETVLSKSNRAIAQWYRLDSA
ncbi:phospholipase D family protein [Janthinobacterium sp. SUN118]|uniref:phospholipase D family protein n=1 Tax=Janthinobacterium sp. SUN118 TaxID=3004100 RepID=UPI0025B12D4B|nr:phospholipase D family protein [Janthinobacterium sp. SUN118]MDN2713222.1 phospholipase D family protein [Janthinobacterium sp. SUN118]